MHSRSYYVVRGIVRAVVQTVIITTFVAAFAGVVFLATFDWAG